MGCGCPMPRNVKGQVGSDFEQCGLVGDISTMTGEFELYDL